MGGVEAGEIACFHGDGAGCAADEVAELDDVGIFGVEFAERGLAVKAECDEELIARPGELFGHGGMIGGGVGWRKGRVLGEERNF